MQYIYKSKTHTDTSTEFLVSLGMSVEQIESIQNQLNFELSQYTEKAKSIRDTAINSPVDVNGMVFDCDANARDNINEAVNNCTRNGLPETTTVNWILADNTVAEITLADLKAVLNAYTSRMSVIYQQYTDWRAGDKSNMFTAV